MFSKPTSIGIMLQDCECRLDNDNLCIFPIQIKRFLPLFFLIDDNLNFSQIFHQGSV